MIFKLLPILFSLSSACAFSAEIPLKDEMEILAPNLYREAADTEAKFELPLSFVQFENLDWTRDQILTQLTSLAKIYRQCSVRVGEVKIYHIRSVQAPLGLSYSHPESEIGYKSLAQKVLVEARPLVFLVHGMAKDEHDSSFSLAKWKIFPKFEVDPSVNSTAWLIHAINDPEYDRREHPNCLNCVLPHELGHILMRDNQHNGDRPPNLMSGAKLSGRTSFIPPSICEEIVASELVKRLP